MVQFRTYRGCNPLDSLVPFERAAGEHRRLPWRTEFDILTKKILTHSESMILYRGLISWKKRQLSKREIRRLGLREENR